MSPAAQRSVPDSHRASCDNTRYGLFNAVISTGLDLRFEPLLLLARDGDDHGAILSPFPRLPNPLELLLVLDAALDIVPRTLTHADDVVLAHLAHRLGRRAEDHRAVGEALVLDDDGAGADQAILADHRVVQHHGLDADQAAVADRAAMQHHLVAHRHALAERERRPEVGVQHAILLDVGIVADHDRLVVAAHHGAGHDGHPLAQGHRADDRRLRGDVAGGGDDRHLVAQLIDGHLAPFRLRKPALTFT